MVKIFYHKVIVDGKIDGFSENLAVELAITDNDMTELHDKLHIFHLIPNLFEYINLMEKEALLNE